MNEPIGSNSEFWDMFAHRYERISNKYGQFSQDWVREHAHEIAGMSECRVLDFACGPGLNIKVLREVRGGLRVDGVDISSKMVDLARATGNYERLWVQDLNNLPLDATSDAYDLVVAFGIFEFLPDLDSCLSECHRVLKKNGTLWASFQRHEAGDPYSPPRRVGMQTGYSAGEIHCMVNRLNMRVNFLDAVVGYITSYGFSVPYYVLQARKT